jgi:hypothetical protein
MADDRMRNDDLEKNMGGAGQNKENLGQQTPGRKQNEDDDLRTGQRGAHEGRGGQQNEPHEDDFGTPGNKGTGQGGQKRGNL